MTMGYPKRPDVQAQRRTWIREELYRYLNYQEAVRQFHAARWAENTERGGHPEPCSVCENSRREMQFTKDMIRHFGGKPR